MSETVTDLAETFEIIAGEFGGHTLAVARCRECGQTVHGQDSTFRGHRRVCESHGTAFSNDDRCPSCGEPYDSYLTHVGECEGLGGE